MTRGARRTIRRLLIPITEESLTRDVETGFLTERQRHALASFYGLGIQAGSMQSVADDLGVDRKAAARLRDTALLKLYERHLSKGTD